MELFEFFCQVLKMKTDCLQEGELAICWHFQFKTFKLYLAMEKLYSRADRWYCSIIIWVWVLCTSYALSLSIKTHLWNRCYHIQRPVSLRGGKEPTQGQTASTLLSWIQTWVSLIWRFLLPALFTIAHGYVTFSRCKS